MLQDEPKLAVAADPAATPEELPVGKEIPPLSTAQSIWYSIASLGCGMFFSFNNAALTLFLKRYTTNPIIIGLMGSTHSVEGAVIQPIIGTLSDRHRSRLGRRRPFMLVFIPLSALFMAATPVSTSLPPGIRLAALMSLIFAFTVTFNVAFDPYQALMPDITPAPQRGRVMALWSLLGVLGQASILMIPVDISVKFYLVAAVMLATMLLTCAFVREPPSNDQLATDLPKHNHWRDSLRGILELKEARKGLLVFFLSGLGVGAVLPYLTIFVQTITNCSDQQAQLQFMVLMISTAVTVLPAGKLSDKIGAQRVLLASMLLIGVASIAALWVQTLPQITAVLIVAGLGNAAQSAATYPLMTQLVPPEEVGWYTGLQTTALSIAQPFTVVLTGTMIKHGSYRSIFLICGISMFLALAVVAAIRQSRANAEIESRRRAMGWQEWQA
jgi:Na+/melibiose symporter-like transporter